jgi:hypothetical protein
LADELDPLTEGTEPVLNSGALPDSRSSEPTPLPEYVGPNLTDRARGGAIATRFFVGRLWRALLPLAAIAGVAALVIAAFFLPEQHRAEIETQMADHLGMPVTFGALSLSPNGGGSLSLSEVRVPALPSVRVKALYLLPDWGASIRALDWRFRMKLVDVQGAPEALARLLSARFADGMVTGVEVEDGGLNVGGQRWGGLSGQMSIGGVSELNLTDAAKTLTVQVVPVDQGLRLDIVGINRSLAVFPRISFDTYQLVGTVSDSALTLEQFGASVFHGKLGATGQLRFEEGAVLDTDITLGNVDGSALLSALGSGFRLGGAVDGRFKVIARAASPEGLNAAQSISGTFSVQTGVLNGMDFGAALRERGMGKLQGGETRFEQFEGKLTYQDKRTEVTITRLQAGALDASGSLDIGALEALSGRVSAVVLTGGRRMRVPVTVSGSLAAPVLESPKPVEAPPAVQVTPKPDVGDAGVEGGVPPGADPAEVFEVPVQPGDLR